MRGLGSLALVIAVAACSGTSGEEGTGTTASTAPTPTFTGDGSAFCDAMLGVGQIEGATSPEEVLAENERLVGFLDEAQANTPEDAPSDFDALLDDYRAASQAIAEAGGDVDAAFAALERDAPEVVERLASSTSHPQAYAFLVERCGITAP